MLNLKNTLDGYLKNVEVIGNTIQDKSNLADIRSVGDKVEGQELYKIDVASCGKNLFDKDSKLKLGYYYGSNGDIGGNGVFDDSNRNFISEKFYEINSNTITWSSGDSTNIRHTLGLAFYDEDKNFISRHESTNIVNYVVPGNAKYFRIKGDYNRVDALQLEEGTQATPYEPYKENKLEILSPVQLEKVGDVADRIICKDGVWGIEKNIKTHIISQDTVITHHNNHENGTTSYRIENVLEQPNLTIITSKFKQIPFSNLFTRGEVGHASHESTTHLYVRLEGSTTTAIAKQQLQGMLIKCMTLTPQFIPLPQDQQVKLRTFAGQTNIVFNTEIQGQVKAQVPKSLGAVVNTHTQQIEMLHNALKSVLAGDMYSLATILYPEDFTQDNSEQDIMVIPE